MNKLAGRRGVVKVSYTPPQWEREARGWSHNPPVTLVLVVFALIWLLATVWPTVTAGGREAEHRMVSPACAEAARLRSHGAVGAPSYRRVAAACARSDRP